MITAILEVVRGLAGLIDAIALTTKDAAVLDALAEVRENLVVVTLQLQNLQSVQAARQAALDAAVPRKK